MIGATVPAVQAAAVTSEVARHSKASVFQAGFWRESTDAGIEGEGRREMATSDAVLRPVLSLIFPSRPLRSNSRIMYCRLPVYRNETPFQPLVVDC